jgi:hypothetical protein
MTEGEKAIVVERVLADTCQVCGGDKDDAEHQWFVHGTCASCGKDAFVFPPDNECEECWPSMK